MARKTVEIGVEARRTCPCFGVFCFVRAFMTSLFGAKSASADTPVAAIKINTLSAPAITLGFSSSYVISAALERPEVRPRGGLLGFTLSRDLVDLVNRVEKLAVHGVELNQRKLPHREKLNLRLQSRLGGGVVQLYYRH